MVAMHGTSNGKPNSRWRWQKLATLLLIFVAQAGQAAVIGQDDRHQVGDSSSFPFRTIGLIETDDATCTATLIGPQQILTAAHCLVDLQGQARWKRNPYFTAASSGIGDQKYPTQLIRKVYVDKNYLAATGTFSDLQPLALDQAPSAALDSFIQNTLTLDYAVAELDQPIGDQTGWIGLQTISGNNPPFVQLGGYPIDKGRYWQWFALCQTKSADQGPWLQRCDLSPGMSGASALVRDYDDSYAAVGVYAAGSPQHNFLIPLTADLSQRLINWRQGKSDNQTEVFTFKHDPGYPIRLANTCSKAINAVIHYRNAAGEWITSNWQEAAAGQQRLLARSSSPTFYLYAEIAGPNGARWEGKDLQRRIGNSQRQYGFSKIVIKDPRPVPYVRTLRCP